MTEPDKYLAPSEMLTDPSILASLAEMAGIAGLAGIIGSTGITKVAEPAGMMNKAEIRINKVWGLEMMSS